MLIPLVQTSNEIEEMYNSNIFMTQFIRGYFYPRIDKLSSCRNKKIQNNQKLKYKEIQVKFPRIKYRKIRLNQYNNFNTIFDMTEYFNLFNETYSKLTFNIKVNKFALFLKEVTSKVYVTNQNNIIYINPKEIITTGKKDSIENYIFWIYKNQLLDHTWFGNFKFVFSTNTGNRFFVCTFPENPKEFNFIKFKRFCNILCKLSKNTDLDEEEFKELNMSDELNKAEEVKNVKDNVIHNKAFPIKNKIIKGLDLDKKSLSRMNNTEFETHQRIMDKIDLVSQNSESSEEVEAKLNDDNEFLEDLEYLKNQQTQQSNPLNQKRIAKLEEKQSKVMVDGKSIDSIISEHKTDAIEVEEINIETLNEEVKTSTLKDFDRSYVKNQKEKDLFKVLSSFNEVSDNPFYVTAVTKEDTSDAFNKKETLKITLEDGNGKKHNIKLDIPIIIDDSFLYLNDGKKSISKQLITLPIIKVAPDEVRITAVDKVFVNRIGQKLNSNVDRLIKFLKKDIGTTNEKIKVKFGTNKGVNSKFHNSMEYDDIGCNIISLQIGSFYLNFNRNDANAEISKVSKFSETDDFAEKDKEFVLGCDKNTIYVVDIVTQKVIDYSFDHNKRVEYDTIFDLISLKIKELDSELYEKLLAQKASKKFAYTRARVTGQKIPIIVLLGFLYGLENVLKRYNVNYTFEEKRPKFAEDESFKYNVIQFNDGYLIYDAYPMRNALLLNGLQEVPVKVYDFAQFNSQDVYLDFFELLYNKRNAAKGFKNFFDFLLDPITVDVLKDLNLPTNVFDVLLYANTLLEDNSYTNANNMCNYRVRSIEMINTYVYDVLSDAIRAYNDSYRSGVDEKKLQVQQDAVIKAMLESPIIEEYSTLNPVLEVEKLGAANYKGIAGTNLSDAFTAEIRAYDKSMVGLLGMSTPDSATVGVVRQLSYDPKIINNRGIIDIDDSVNDFDATNLLTAGELLSPYTSLHADPPRIGMETQQARHTVPTYKQSKSLYGSGVERTLPYMLSSDFVAVAKEDGTVESIDETNQMAIIKYKDGTTDVIDLAGTLSKNGNGGFYIQNNIHLMVKEGQKVKKGQLLAKNPNYFLGDKPEDVTFAQGYLAKVAMSAGDFTLEDSSIITEDLSEAMSCDVTMLKQVQLGPNTNVLKIVKKGQHVKTGEELISFEHSFEDAEANKLLDSLDDDFGSFIEDIGHDSVLTKYSGEVADIKIYYNVDFEELSPSLQNIIKKYKAEVTRRENIAKKNGATNIIFPPTEKINNPKIKGRETNGVIIEFYVKHKDNLAIGDKIVYGTAIKTIVSDVIPKGEEPFSESHPDENIDAIFTQLSIVSRMTTDAFNMLYSNKLIIELKRKCKEIWES
jgi:hypothetical protein